MTILDQRPGYRLWLDNGKMYDHKNGKPREILDEILKAMLLTIHGDKKNKEME